MAIQLREKIYLLRQWLLLSEEVFKYYIQIRGVSAVSGLRLYNCVLFLLYYTFQTRLVVAHAGLRLLHLVAVIEL